MPSNQQFAGWRRGKGDETHAATGDVLEALVPGEGTATFSRQLHIAQAGDHNTDFNLAAQAHPTWVLHSTTTPATDYLLVNHDGTTVQYDGVGATEHSFQLAGAEYLSVTTSDLIVNEASNDIDVRIEGANNANLLVLDGGTDSVGLGGAVTTGAFASITPAAQTRDMVTSVGSWLHIPADSQDINAAGNCATLAIGSAIFVGQPTWTSTATGLTVTDSTTLYIADAPCASTNVTATRSYALWVDAGAVRFDGTMTIGACSPVYTWPASCGTCGQQLTCNGSGTLSWAAASVRDNKDLHGIVCGCLSYERVRNVPVYEFTYKPEIANRGQWTAGGSVMTGIVAEDAPWAMQGRDREAFSPINAFGTLTAAFQNLAQKVEALEAQS